MRFYCIRILNKLYVFAMVIMKIHSLPSQSQGLLTWGRMRTETHLDSNSCTLTANLTFHPPPPWVLLPKTNFCIYTSSLSLAVSEIQSLTDRWPDAVNLYTQSELQKPNLVLNPYDKVIHTDGQTWKIYAWNVRLEGAFAFNSLLWYHTKTRIITELTVLM
jgi:hypothetical protein